jgi:hypothetical protein
MGHDQKYNLSQRPPAQRVAWILPPKAGKDRGAKRPNRCGLNRVRSTRFGKPNRPIQIPAIINGTGELFSHHQFLFRLNELMG